MLLALIFFTLFALLVIVKVYPGMVKDELKKKGHKYRKQTGFIFNELNIFSLFFWPFGMLLGVLVLTAILTELIGREYIIGLNEMAFIYVLLFATFLNILFIESRFYFMGDEEK